MTRPSIYQTPNKWRFGTALAAALAIHLAAISFATSRQVEPRSGSGVPTPPDITLEVPDPITDPKPQLAEPLPTPPVNAPSFVDATMTTPPPVRRQAVPLSRPRTNAVPGSMKLSSAKVFALHAPRPEYPYEARRQRITGDGIAVITIDTASGSVIQVAMLKSTGNVFLDNAALIGFKRWRFKPGTISSVVCPVTFTLTGASY